MTYPVFSFLQRLLLLSRQFTLLAIIACSLGGGVYAQNSATGVVSGRVFSPATGEYIRNAEVRIQGTQQFALTEDGGFYRLDNALRAKSPSWSPIPATTPRRRNSP